MKSFLKILTFLWFSFWLVAGVSTFLYKPGQITIESDFIKKEIKPSVDFVNNFNMSNGRLPDYREYYTWQRDYYNDYNSDLKQQVDSLIPGMGTMHYIRKLSDVANNDQNMFENADWNKDFAISVWNGDWSEYYFSKPDIYYNKIYSWQDKFIGLVIMIGIGIFPLLYWWLNIRQKRKLST